MQSSPLSVPFSLSFSGSSTSARKYFKWNVSWGRREGRERERVFLCYFCKVTSLEIHTVQCSLVVYLATHVGLVYKCKCFIGSFQPSWRAVILTKDILTKILEQWCFLGIVVVLCILFVFCIRFKTSQNQISFSFCLKLWILMTLTL